MLLASIVLSTTLTAAEKPAAPVLPARGKIAPAAAVLKQPAIVPVNPPPVGIKVAVPAAPVAVPAAPVVVGIGGRAFIPGGLVITQADRGPGQAMKPGTAIGGPADEALLRNARLQTTDDALLAFFRLRTPPAPAREKIDELVRKLGDADPNLRDAAQADLTGIGQASVPFLRTAANNVDNVEASTRARACLQNIEGSAASSLVTHAARLLAQRRPATSAEVLLGYLPFAEDETTFQEVELALVQVALRDGKPDPALIKALKDPLPIRRGTAAQVICQAGGQAYHDQVRPLLRDGRPSVRLRAALGLVGAYDAEAIPVLIELLGDLQPRLRQQAEEYLTQLAGEWAVSGPRGNDQMSRQLRRDVWSAWWKNTDGIRLLEEFRSRATSDEDYLKVSALIARLGDEKPEVREAASNDLVSLGRSAASLLRRAVNDNHPRISPQAARCLESIEKDAPGVMPAAAARLLGLRKPPGTVEALLTYLPFCESADLAEQLTEILAAVAVPGGKPDASLVKALEDRIPARRALAASSLCRGRALSQVPAIRRLLKDADADVRLKTAQGLSLLGEKEAIPVLIALLRDLPIDQAWDIEDYLNQLAGDQSPTEVLTAEVAGRAKAVSAWEKWWAEHNKTVDLARGELGRRDMGVYVLIENWNPALGRGRVLEVDASGKVRWEIKDLQWPNDAQVLRGGNVLVVEQQNRVTERDRNGKVVGLDRNYPSVFQVERLRDGSTFVACRNQLQIVDARGVATFNYPYTANSILAARRFRDGTLAFVSYSGHYVKLDRTGKEMKNVQIPNWGTYSPNGADILPGDRIVLSESRFNKVLEFGLDGKPTWECPVTYPLAPTVAGNGNILVAGNSNTAIYEIDRKGKLVKEWKGFAFRPFRVVRR
ncbi:MAG: HEAT repeat domain-containing protein [Gemmataceae bacterium]